MKYTVTKTTVQKFSVEAESPTAAVVAHEQGKMIAETASFQASENPQRAIAPAKVAVAERGSSKEE